MKWAVLLLVCVAVVLIIVAAVSKRSNQLSRSDDLPFQNACSTMPMGGEATGTSDAPLGELGDAAKPGVTSLAMDIDARIVLCILHDEPSAIRELCREADGFEYDEQYSGLGSDTRMLAAFAMSDNSLQPTLTDEDQIAISKHQDVAYVHSPGVPLAGDARGPARQSLSFVSRAFDSGARAIKCESSGLAHGRAMWLLLARQAAAVPDDTAVLYRAWVRRPLKGKRGIHSTGMHLLGLPDINVVDESPEQSLQLIDACAIDIMATDGFKKLLAGRTFRVAAQDEVYFVDWGLVSGYAPGDLFFNPFGIVSLSRNLSSTGD